MKKLFVSALAILGLVACAKDDVVSVQDNRTAIGFDTYVENVTRVGYTTDNLDGFDVWAYMGDTRILTDEDVTKVSGNYTYGNTQYWIPGQPYFFAALAPLNSNLVDDANVSKEGLGEITFTNVDGTTDLIYSTYSVTADGSQDKVNFQFNHLLSKVKFSFVNAFDNANYAFTVENITMTAPEKASIDLTANGYTWYNHADEITLDFGDNPTDKASMGNTVSSTDLLTIPAASYEYNVTFDVNLYVAGALARTYNKEAKISGIAFEAGKGYSLTATIDDTTFNLESIDFDATVNDWDETSAPAYEPYKVEVDGVNYDDLAVACGKAMELDKPVNFFQHVVVDADTTIEVPAGKTLTLNLNGYTLTGVTDQTGSNRNMFDVRGIMNVNGAPITRASAAENGTISVKHIGDNMLWNNSTNVFNVTAGGVLNLENLTGKNLGGSDMAFVAHLNNWGECTLNVEKCTLESTYIAVRVFNSGYDMNNVTIAKTELKGKYCFWVQCYQKAGDSVGTDDTLNLNIYNPAQENTFTYTGSAAVLFGFANPINVNEYGISKKVSDDGSVVEVGTVVDNGTLYRNHVGAEENNTIKKVVVGEGITTLYDRTFRRFYALETVELPSTLTHIGVAGSGVFQSCTNLKNVVLPESLIHLGKGSFQECSSLTSINIPQGVTRIEENALRATGLVSVEFHEGVTYFGLQAFRDCKQLKSVVIKAPQFTVEANAFGVMAGTLPGTIIYVANEEMKDYLESTLAYANQFTVVVMGTDNNVASNDNELKDVLDNAQSGDTVYVAAGQYNALPDVKDGVIVEAGGAVFNGVSHVRGNGATVKGATFVNNFTGDNDNCLTGALNNTTFENCVFESYSALRWCNATGDIVFTNCKFGTERSWRGVHFDTGDNTTITFNNCDLYGFQAIGSTVDKVIFNNCNFFKGRSTNVVNMYASVYEYNDCEFVAGYYCDCADNGVTATFNSCSYVDNSNIINIVRFDKDPSTCTITFDGQKYVSSGLLCNESTNTYTAYSGAGFKYMATSVLNDGSKNVTIELANDIDLAGIEWPAVRTNAAFVFDGKGKTIKNLTTSAVESNGFYCTALFSSTRKATTIKNLVVENATVTGNGQGDSHGAVLVATNWAALNIEGVTVKGSTVSNCDRSSVLVTYLYFTTATVKDCVVEGCTVNSIGTAGALLGMNNSHNFTATGNTVKGTTISSSEGSNKAGILIGTWQNAGTLTESENVVEDSKAINAGTETNNEIGRHA